MLDIARIIETPGRRTVCAAPEGADARFLAQFVAGTGGRDVLHVARDDARLAVLEEALGFFDPARRIIRFPAWDCLPYDRASPGGDLVAQRVAALCELAEEKPAGPGRIILTTISALLQRVPAPDAFAGTTLRRKTGERIADAELRGYLAANGYHRADMVMEAGEYAFRGDIADIFPPGEEEPQRLDLFGDEIERIRRFDPMSQQTTGEAKELVLRPVSEVMLDEASIARFRSRYREHAGKAVDDPLYEAISEGARHPGFEHWLPFFHERLATLLDYVPGATISLDPQFDEAAEARFELIAEYFAARKSLETGGVPPLDPDAIYIGEDELRDALAAHPVLALTPFDQPEGGQVISAGARRSRDFAAARQQQDINLFDEVAATIAEHRQAGRRVVIAGYSAGSLERLRKLLDEHGVGPLKLIETWPEADNTADKQAALLTVLALEHGFEDDGIALLTEQDILGERIARRARRKRSAEHFLSEASSLAEGDLVVHAEHGIGRYDGLITLDVGGVKHDCLRLVYDGGDKLFLPVENIEVLTRFGEDSAAQLDKLGGGAWQGRKARMKKKLRDMAEQLIAIAAKRELNKVERQEPPAGIYDEFAAKFPFSETEDQLRAIGDVMEDFAAGRPMDRLVCGDVGFGKTEVALRAAFIAAMNGWQVAIVVPTTLLARQHYATFAERFAGLPLEIAQLSRLVTGKAATQVKEGLAEGSVNIVVGTHALLAKSVQFDNLGLVIVDEEQHFGVQQKERLKSLRAEVHVLTLTATPIPRTLQLALTGVRDMSLITTPPVDRLAVRTFVTPYDPVVIREALLREQYRGGQSYYVVPRIKDLDEVERRLAELVPELKIVRAHGRMRPNELEDVMTGFVEGKFDILLCTHIIESGLDIPRVNTIVIHRAEMFGLSQLYQLRGRVGRGKQRAYAYLTTPANRLLAENAQRRLEVMQTLDTLGAGFTLASHDLDIRGAGNLLGEEQSGHIREVGVELYQHMLEEAVAAARGDTEEAGDGDWSPQINLGVSVMIPDSYVAELGVRLALYRRLATLESDAEIDAFAAELVDRFGPLPPEVETLLDVVSIKLLCKRAGVAKVDAGPKGATVAFRDDSFANPGGLVELIQEEAGTLKLRSDHRLVWRRNWETAKDRLNGLRQAMGRLADIAA